jgi:protein TonB
MLKRFAFLARFSGFEIALALSVSLHAAVFVGSSLSFGGAPKQIHNRGLDVILVNNRSTQKPRDVQALAQVNLDGGGNTDKDRRASTPVPPMLQNNTGEQLEQQMKRRLQELEARKQELLARNSQIKIIPEEPLQDTRASPLENGQDLLESARAMARMDAEISKEIEEYNKRPRKRFVGVRTQGIHEALYVEQWRQKVEKVGTLNYPAAAKGRLHGSLTITVTIDKNGNVVGIEIDKSSGNKTLDDAARRIIRLAAPYAPLSSSIAQDYDHLVITRVITFSRNDSIEAR